MKRQSIASRINFILITITIVIVSYSAIVVFLGSQVNNTTEEIIEYELPAAFNTLEMLDELGEMNSNLLEYVSGEPEEKQEYFNNIEEFNRYSELMPRSDETTIDIDQVVGIVSDHKEQSQARVFNVYDPYAEKKAADQINSLIKNVGQPLESLLDRMKEEEISDVGTHKNTDDIINDDLPGVRLYLELVDETGDMLSDLDRYVLGDEEAKRSFFSQALEFETYLAQLKPLEQKPDEIVKINEIERLFNELKSKGASIFDTYQTKSKSNALEAIDYLEHQSFFRAENLLEKLSNTARNDVNLSMTGLREFANQISIVLTIATLVVISLTIAILIYARRSIFKPIAEIGSVVERLRKGERNFELRNLEQNNELSDILSSLQQFQIELAELDELRSREKALKTEAVEQRDKAQSALSQLKDAQNKLVANEKMASLGTLVAGISHEVNTPLGISVTMSSTLSHNIEHFLSDVKSGTLKRTSLEKFEQESAESLALLSRSLDQASNLIHSFKKVAIDQTSSKRREFNLRVTIDEILSTLHHQIKRTSIIYDVEGDDDIVMDSYPGPLGQVITNLFNNAILHAFENRDKGEIHIRFSRSGDEVRILFSDNGSGVDSDHMNKLFDPFFTTKLGKGGSGLGLNIVHNIVSGLLGGTIHVESKVGTTFEILLPLTAPQNQTTQST